MNETSVLKHKHSISSAKSFTRQLKKCAYMHHGITENTWKAEEKRHKLKQSRKHVINTSRRYLGKNWIATKGGPPYPDNERGQSMFLVFIAVSGAIEKNFFTFRLKQYTNAVLHQTRCSFCFTAMKEKSSKNWLENTTLENIWYSVHRNAQFQWQLQQKKKRFHQFSYIILSPGNKVRRHNNRNEWKSAVTTHQKVSRKLTA